MWLGSVLRVILLLPCAVATLPHQTAVGDNTSDREPKLDHSRPDHLLASRNPNHITGQIDGGKEGAWGHKQEDEKNAPNLLSRSLNESPTTTEQENTSHPGPERPSWKAQCFGMVEYHGGVLVDLLNALFKGWGRESELAQEDLTRFGLCSDADEKSSRLLSTLSMLSESAEEDRNRLRILHPTKELWEVDAEGQSSGLTLHFLLPSPLRAQLPRLSSVLLFFLGSSIQTGGQAVSFTSHSLKPHQQTVCISVGTQFIVLTGTQMESHAHGHVTLQITVETNQAENGESVPLCFQDESWLYY
ncbi:uncharacterized protein LOC118772826 [Megalops cyprinoides]|uniref:uncharacterized protein LOC118772826 n=1 Tax=Megalops cyprinoides TaxID=118141 RepID=UPI0018646A20|nr:uncharacterized protein LOC118772826 [Megalops cyprinoides]